MSLKNSLSHFCPWIQKNHSMPPIKRKRVIKTCNYCYRHKVRCDKLLPCSRCVKNGEFCEYTGYQQPDDKKSPKRAPEHLPQRKKTPRLLIPELPSSIYYSRGFQPFLSPKINRVLLFKLASRLPKNNIFDYDNSMVTNAAEIITNFPSKSLFDELLPQYWDCVHPLVPILYREDIDDKYNQFWDNLDSEDDPIFDVNYGLILLSMLFATQTSYKIRTLKPKCALDDGVGRIYECFEKIKNTCGLTNRATFDFLKASIIIYFTGASYYSDLFTATSTLSRLAETLGLHRDPVLHHENPASLSAKEIDSRRYIWNFIRYLDTLTSIQNGLSPHMILINSSTNFPSKNEYNPITKEFDGPVSPFRLFSIALFKANLVLETVIHCLNFDFKSREEKMFKMESVYLTVMSLYNDVGKIIGEMLACDNYPPELISFLVSHISSSVHRVFLLHISGETDPNPYQNKIITNDPIKGVDLEDFGKAVTIEFIEDTLSLQQHYSTRAIQVILLLIYESKENYNTPESMNKFKWFHKNKFPMQHLTYLLIDISNSPDKDIELNSLPPELHRFYLPQELMSYSHSYDIRRFVIDSLINSSENFIHAGDELLRDSVASVRYVRDFVWKKIDKSGTNSIIAAPPVSQNVPNLTHPPHQSPDSYQMFSDMDKAPIAKSPSFYFQRQASHYSPPTYQVISHSTPPQLSTQVPHPGLPLLPSFYSMYSSQMIPTIPQNGAFTSKQLYESLNYTGQSLSSFLDSKHPEENPSNSGPDTPIGNHTTGSTNTSSTPL